MAGHSSNLRFWSYLHTYSSLVCSLFLLVSCVCGLPLVFNDEIGDLLQPHALRETLPAGTPSASLNELAALAPRHY